MNRSVRRHHAKRIIRKRIKIIKGWRMGNGWPKHIGKLRKYNLACGCKICKLGRHTKPEEPPNGED